jgi:hypothetical protein
MSLLFETNYSQADILDSPVRRPPERPDSLGGERTVYDDTGRTEGPHTSICFVRGWRCDASGIGSARPDGLLGPPTLSRRPSALDRVRSWGTVILAKSTVPRMLSTERAYGVPHGMARRDSGGKVYLTYSMSGVRGSRGRRRRAADKQGLR